jgi:hypothetical protein
MNQRHFEVVKKEEKIGLNPKLFKICGGAMNLDFTKNLKI